MKRAAGIILGILLGAIAAGLGIGLFLHKANQDRAILAEQISKTNEIAVAARQENQAAIEEANKKLKAANAEVAKAQNIIKTLEEERQRLFQATPLLQPAPKYYLGWSEIIGIEQGVSLKSPPGSVILTNDSHALVLSKAQPTQTEDLRWLSYTKYDNRLENEMLGSLTTTTRISYLVDGHVIAGVSGKLPNQKEDIIVLSIYSNGDKTHLLWLKTPGIDNKVTQNILASLRFKD